MVSADKSSPKRSSSSRGGSGGVGLLGAALAAASPFGNQNSENNAAKSAFRAADLQLLVRDVRDHFGGIAEQEEAAAAASGGSPSSSACCGGRGLVIPVTVRAWSTVKDVKDAIQAALQIPAGSQRLYFGPLLSSGGELPNHRTLHDAGIYRSGETLLLDIKGSSSSSSSPSAFSASSPPLASSLYSLSLGSANDVCISSSMVGYVPKRLRSIVQEARRGLSLGFKPVLSLEGSAGTYFLHGARKQRVAVFKPADEEPYAPNNPRGYLRQPGQPMCLREGVDPGQACIREVAAYLLDRDGFSGVPMTTLAEARHPTAFNTNGSRLKVSEGGAAVGSHSVNLSPNAGSSPASSSSSTAKAGSLQEFVSVECTMDDLSPSKLSAEQVHKIAILDIRLLNADRNAANLLVRRTWEGSLELVPIDHGYCLRAVPDVSWMDWCWLDWPQLKQPLSEAHRAYVESLDIEADARVLSEVLNVGQEAVDYFRASSSLLKAGIKAGLSLYEIACLCCRNDNLAEVPSMLEKLFDMAEELASAAMENDRWGHTAASRALAEQLSPQRRKRNSSMLSLVTSSLPTFRFSRADDVDDGELLDELCGVGSDGSPQTETSGSEDGAPSGLSRALHGAGRDSPALLAQSSASDSSSEAGCDDLADGAISDKDLCEEWAASVILDASLEHPSGGAPIIPATHRRTARSGSVVSEDGSSGDLSTSPKGFWYIRPGASPVLGGDDLSVAWSPCSSPRPSPRTSSIANSDRSDVPSPLLPLEDSPDVKFAKTVTVSFANIAPGPYLPPQSALKVSPFKAEANTGDFPFLQRTESGMSRSKSYSALSAAGSASKRSYLAERLEKHHHDGTGDRGSASRHRRVADAIRDYGENYDAYRKYFHSFIDLVIVRETSAVRGHHDNAGAAAKKKPSSSPSPPATFRLGL